MQFLIPKEPRLHWGMLYPNSRKRVISPSLTGKPTFPFFWARNAIYHGLKVLNITSNDNILVPSYHCSTVVEPILEYGAKVKFYNIRRDCFPDLEDIQKKIDKETKAVLAIHYFGFPQPIRRLQEFCKAHRLYLIEDCAHVLGGEVDGAPLGSFGDISIFSWRKFFPIYDGGHLIINNPALHADIPWERNTLLFYLKVAKNIFDKLTDDSLNGNNRVVSKVLQLPYSVIRRSLLRDNHQSKAFAINSYNSDFDVSSVNLGMTLLSKYILRNIDFCASINKRRVNYANLLERIEPLHGIRPLFSDLPDGICPWVFPLIVDDQEEFHTVLRARGIPAVTWGGVIHPNLALDEFPEAAFLYRNLIFLPVHQGIGESEIETMIGIMARALIHDD